MTELLLIPLDDTVVFPTMDVTLPIDVDGEQQVLLVPRHEGEYASGRHDRPRRRVDAPARRRPRRGAHRASRAECSAPPGPTPSGACGSPPRSASTTCRWTAAPATSSASTAPWSRRSSSCAAPTSASRRSCARSCSRAPLADTAGYSPDLTFEQKVGAARGARRHRAPPEVPRLAARAPDPAAGPQADPRGRRVRRPEAAARVLPAQADGVHPPRAGRGRRLGRRGLPDQDRRGRACPTHVREQAERELERLERSGRAVRRGADDPHVPRLAHHRAVDEALRRDPRPGPRA